MQGCKAVCGYDRTASAILPLSSTTSTTSTMASTSKSEKAYICSSLLADPSLRADGRSLLDYRPIALETQVAALANGSARINIGGVALNGIGGGIPGTEVLATVKLEVENVSNGEGSDSGRMVCSVSWFVSLTYDKHNHCHLNRLQNRTRTYEVPRQLTRT